METTIKKHIDGEVKQAKADPELDVSELYNDAYQNNVGGKVRGLLPWLRHDHKTTQKAVNV
jgi:hypothetical protein